jgi:predicted RNA-binding protein associated with RNAse of E/G family
MVRIRSLKACKLHHRVFGAPEEHHRDMDAITVHKLDGTGNEILSYQGRVLERSNTRVTLEARYDRESITVFGLELRRGDRFVESFYTDRWYAVFAIYDGEDGRLKGWYCDIARPARVEAGHVYSEDLALDVIIDLRGSWRVIDEEEFAALDLTLEERQQALKAVTQIQSLVVRRRGPFQELA